MPTRGSGDARRHLTARFVATWSIAFAERRNSLTCHVRHAVCRVRPAEGGVALTRVRPATPTVAYSDH